MPTHEERLSDHDVTLAVHSQQIGALMKANEAVVNTMNKLIWAALAGSTSVTVALLGAIIAIIAKK